MMTIRHALAMLGLALLAACGDDAASAAPEPATPPALAGPAGAWETMPIDSLYGATAAENVRVTTVVLDVRELPEGWDGMQIVAISDLQLGLWSDSERVAAAAIRRAVAENPDLIVLLGDYIAEGSDTAALARVLAPLRGRAALAVLGDRDVRSDSMEAWITATLNASGVRVLKNGSVPITRNGATAHVAGVDPEIVDDSWGDQEYILATLGGGAATPLLLLHHPPLAARAPEGKFSAVLAGNTFCGPVEVPGTPRLRWLTDEALPGAAVEGVPRLFRVEEAVMFVTCGVGYSFVPTRFGGQPEIALVTLTTAGAEDAEEEGASAPADTLLERYGATDTAGTG